MKKKEPRKKTSTQVFETLGQQLSQFEPRETEDFQAPKTLMQDSRKWEQAFEALSDQIMILDRSGMILWANKAVCEQFQTTYGKIIGLNYRIPYYGTTQLDSPPPWEPVLAGALSAVVETLLPSLGGWFLVSCYPLYGEDGAQWGAISVVKEITSRKRVEEALRNIAQGAPAAGSVAFFRSLVKDLSNALNVEYALLAELSGTTKKQVQTVAIRAHGEYVDNFLWQLAESPAERIFSNRNCTWSNNAKNEFSRDSILAQWNVSSYIGSPLIGTSGQIIGLVLAMDQNPLRNVPLAESIVKLFAARAASELERKRAEEALRDSEERYRAIVENSYDLIFEITPKGVLLYMSPNCLEVLGYTVNELSGRNFFDLIHPDERVSLATELQQKMTDFQPGEMVCRLQHKGGEWRWFESHTRPFRTSTGDLVGVVDARDITERRRMEEERLRATKLESVGVLAGGIAHDFNNILTAVFANIGLARMLTTKQHQKSERTIVERLVAAEKACLRARDLTKQLLTFAKGGAPVKNTASMSQLITDTVEFALRGSAVRCELKLANDMWPVEVDEGQMSQVIQNLVINADQAMPEGGVIHVQAENTNIDRTQGTPLKEGRFVKVTIADQGVGIPQEHLSKIFDPYFTTKQKGSGLGLATTYSIMKRHDGHITVHSDVGIGTTFVLYLPAVTSDQWESQEVEEELVIGSGRILVMDDEVEIREVLGEMLTNLGYEADFTNEGKDAITKYKTALDDGHPYRAAIVDLTIPGGMGGKETVRRLQAVDPQVIALVSSGYSNDPVMANPEYFGFKGIIAKPYNLSDLSKVLSRVFSPGRTSSSPA